MDEEIYVSCHAPSLSLLLFETARSIHDQKGLLIGQICNEVTSKKTDENEVYSEHKTAIYLEHCIPIEDQDIIGNCGSINKSKLQKFTDVLQNKIVGWYSFRRNSSLDQSSLSEMLIHQSLLEHLPNIKCQYFVACFMSSNATVSMSTHTFSHVFMTYDPNKARFESLRLKIYTLSDKSVNSFGYTMKNPFPTSRSFDKIIGYVLNEETPLKSVLEIHERISEVLKHMDKKLQNTDKHRLQLEQEVEVLKKKLGSKKRDVLVEEPEKEELKVKTICYDPNIKYGSTKLMNSSNALIMNPLVLQNTSEGKWKAESRKNYSKEENVSVSSKLKSGTKVEQRRNCPCGTTTQHSSSVSPKTNNSILNSCAIEDFSYTSETIEKKVSECNNVQQAKSMEY